MHVGVTSVTNNVTRKCQVITKNQPIVHSLQLIMNLMYCHRKQGAARHQLMPEGVTAHVQIPHHTALCLPHRIGSFRHLRRQPRHIGGATVDSCREVSALINFSWAVASFPETWTTCGRDIL